MLNQFYATLNLQQRMQTVQQDFLTPMHEDMRNLMASKSHHSYASQINGCTMLALNRATSLVFLQYPNSKEGL